MQVSNPNDIKIYNLSAGKSLPEWLTDRKKRSIQKKDVDIRQRIELVQDFSMPTVSHCVQVSKDGNYICATGTYKPRLRCYDVHNLSMKFERGLDCEVVKFEYLSDDYSKIAFMQCDRYIEFHSQFGRYYRTRIPKYGNDLAYHNSSCDLYVVGVSQDIYRLNLEQGRYLSPLETNALSVNCCEFNPQHQLFACGTSQGQVECFDPRVRNRVGVLDVALGSHIEDYDISVVPSVTALKYRDGLNMAVGTSTGHVLLYDLRSDKPLLVKDHQYDLPIKRLAFHNQLELVLSMDKKILKLWNRNTGKAFTAIEPGTNLNDLCSVPGSGLIFMGNEAPKVLTYYIPALGTAPKWCSFLDNLTEELEENNSQSVYDDYKFISRQELEELGLTHLIGSNLLRAYMHGFFMDVRLYHKAKSIVEPFAYDKYRKQKIREKIEAERANRVRLKKLPKVNKDLAEELMDAETDQGAKKKTKKAAATLLADDRFTDLFKNPDFQRDMESEEFRLLNPVVTKSKKKKEIEGHFDEMESEDEGKASEDENSSSSDDEHTWRELKEQHKQLRREKKMQRNDDDIKPTNKPKFFEIKEGQDFKSLQNKVKKKNLTKQSLAERLSTEQDTDIVKETGNLVGNKEMTFRWKKNNRETKRQMDAKLHHKERRNIRRSAQEIEKKSKTAPKFWMGQRVK
ncbi:hypothetical protein ScPMuIL_007252 [Solemya velum]